MVWTELHATLLSRAFEKILGRAEEGAVAFVRCLTPEVVEALSRDATFAPAGWQVFRVAAADDPEPRTISADRAVEMREAKGPAVLLLVDTDRAGAGMDGIYSAAREVGEADLFDEALSLAKQEVKQVLSPRVRLYADRAIKKSRRFGRRFTISPWTEFDFLVRVAASRQHPGELLYLLGLWPVQSEEQSKPDEELDQSRLFVERLLGTSVAGLTPVQRIEALKLLEPTEQQKADLERFLRSAASRPLLSALAELAEKKHLWVNALRIESAAQTIQSIELVPWRTNTGRIAKWSGLVEGNIPEQPPELVLREDADRTGEYAKLEIRWKVRPHHLEKGAAEYRVAIITDMEEELASREVFHSGKKEEKCRFSDDDFAMLGEEALVSAKVILSVIGNDKIEPQESEEFIIRYGSPPEAQAGGVGKKVRTFSEGVIELGDRDKVSDLASSTGQLPVDRKGFVLLRTSLPGKSYRVFSPALIREVMEQWREQSGAVGRWRVKVRASGERATGVEFVLLEVPESATGERAKDATRRMAERFAACRGVGLIYDEKSRAFDTIKEYILAWAALLEEGEPSLALANTVEVQSLSGRTIGLIVLPSHPLRVAWHVAYDNLVFHAAFADKKAPKDIRKELALLDGAMFPPFLPGLGKGTFVFADTLGFHAVGMVPDYDKEPKAAVALLARALGESETADSTPTVGRQSAQILGDEILKYIECHDSSGLLQIHALRAGDGLTVSRALGHVLQKLHSGDDESEEEEHKPKTTPSFVLEFYPSPEQRGIAGRFIAEVREKRRRGAGVVAEEDRWMLESISLPGGINLPRLRWSRKREQEPKTAAHLAVAFDTFESQVMAEEYAPTNRPFFAFGLLSFFEREYLSSPFPVWTSFIPEPKEGEKHPSDRVHTERLVRLQKAVHGSVLRSRNSEGGALLLKTGISHEKAQGLRELHRLCDWVITLDRNAGIEYFDSPRDNREIYEAYVIDCVPEREDLGCLQLITSTSNLEEVSNLLDGALDQMGLSRSRRNAEFLMQHLKALSGRLAIRLTGQKAPTSELIALALSYASCLYARENDDCWTSLRNGFLIPVDDVRDLLPPLATIEGHDDLQSNSKAARPDLIYVSVGPRRGLQFRFIEVKYRRHLRTARSLETVEGIRNQVEALGKRWDDWYRENVCSAFRSVRRAKLARVLRFYADKARRHAEGDHGLGLSADMYNNIVAEIDRMIEKGGDYTFATVDRGDRGWIFCPEYAGLNPVEISPSGWETRIFLFGPRLLPDTIFRDEPRGGSLASPSKSQERKPHSDRNTPPPPSSSASGEAILPEIGREKLDAPSVLLGTDLFSGTEVSWSVNIRGNPHLLVAGLPGMGKTTCLLNICQQIYRAGILPIIFSYHQDIDEQLEQLAIPVRFINFQRLTFNPLQVINRSSRLAYLDVAGALRDIFMAIFPELGDIQGERLRTAIKESFVEKGWDDPDADLNHLCEPPFGRFVEILRANPKPDRGLQTLLARLGELADYGFFDLDESRESLWESDRPVVLQIHASQNDNLQKAFASLVFYSLYKDMFRRGIQDRITHIVVFDEAHRAAKLRLIPSMAKECRKYGISLVLASQEARDFDISLFSAVANYLVLRLNEADAKTLVRNVASSDQERMLIDRIKQIERFKALYFCEGKRKPYQISLSPPL